MFGPVPARKQMFADRAVRKKLRAEAIEDRSPSVFPRRWDVILVDHVKLPKNKIFEHKSVQEVASGADQDGLDWFLEISIEEDIETSLVHTDTQCTHEG